MLVLGHQPFLLSVLQAARGLKEHWNNNSQDDHVMNDYPILLIMNPTACFQIQSITDCVGSYLPIPLSC